MRKQSLRSLSALLTALAMAQANAEVVKSPVVQRPQPPIAVSQPSLLANPITLRGTLGAQEIQAQLRPKADVDEGIEGEYFVFGHSLNILLAGEIDADEVYLEESENGIDVSGRWTGKFLGDVFTGTWQSVDETQVKPFQIKVVPAASRNQGK